MPLTRSRNRDRDERRTRRLFGSSFLVALFLFSGLAQQMHWIGCPDAAATARRDAETPEADDTAPSESETQQPVEDASSAERHANELEGVPSRRPTRTVPQWHFVILLKAPDTSPAVRAILDSGRLNPSPRASGRALRHWLQSQTC